MSLVASVSAGSANTTSVTTGAIDTTGATILAAVVSHFDLTNTLSDSNGNIWTATTLRQAASSKAQLFYVLNPAVGSGHTFTVSGAGATYPTLTVLAFSLASPAYHSENGAFVSATTMSSGVVTPPTAPALVVSGLVCGGSPTSVSGGGLVIAENVAFSGGLHMGGAIAWELQNPAAARDALWAWSGTASAAAATIVAFTGGSAGGGFNALMIAP